MELAAVTRLAPMEEAGSGAQGVAPRGRVGATPLDLLAVFVGGLIGTTLRVLLDLAVAHDLDEFALSTLLVNVVGSFVLGVLVAAPLVARAGVGARGAGPGHPRIIHDVLGARRVGGGARTERRPRGGGADDRAEHRARDARRMGRPHPRCPGSRRGGLPGGESSAPSVPPVSEVDE